MTAIGSAPAIKSLVAEAESALTRIKKEVVSSHDIIPRTELSAFNPQKVKEYYDKYGFRVVRYLQYNVVYGKAERACNAALNEVFKELQFPSSAFPIAMTKFGVGECQAVMNLGAARLFSLNPCVISLTSDPGLADPQTRGDVYGHVFLVLGTSHEALVSASNLVKTKEVAKIFNHLRDKNAVIFDPFLSVVCPVSKFSTEAQPLQKYNELFGTHYAYYVGQFNWDNKKCTTILQEADRIYTLAKSKLSTEKPERFMDLHCMTNYALLTKKLEQDVLPRTLACVKELFSSLEWKTKNDSMNGEWSVWAQGAKEPIAHAVKSLQGLSFKVALCKVKDQDTYVTVLKNPNPDELPTVNNISHVVTAIYPATVARLIAEYASA